MPTSYYLDESGNSGDLSRTDPEFTFGNQEIFSLVAIGVDDQRALCDELDRLKRDYRVQGAELKSSLLIAKPGLIKDLVEYFRTARVPILAEIVDKRYMLVANIVNTIVLPPVGAFDAKPESFLLRNITADYIYHKAPKEVLLSYIWYFPRRV
jgi:hypothetical protein